MERTPEASEPSSSDGPAASADDLLVVDIISDVVCPWCVIGYKQLEAALGVTGAGARIRWRAYELNPAMGEDGQELGEHVAEKYGASREDSAAARDRIAAIGAELGFPFRYAEGMRIVPTFRAHQLLRWAGALGKKHALKMALFTAYFSDGRNVNDPETLAAVAAELGLDAEQARAVLEDGRFADEVRREERAWAELGVQGAPTFIFNERHLVTGAQSVEAFATFIRRLSGADDPEAGGGGL